MRLSVCVAFVISLLGGPASGAAIRAMILDGQNNHDWKATTPVMEELLLETGRFSVDVVTSPPAGSNGMAAFNPDFAPYDVVILNYTGESWNDRTQDAFVEYVRDGGGVVVVHAADNAFGDWNAYNEMIGFGGWGGRTQASGPYLYLENGKLVHDYESQGPAGAHEGYDRILIDNRIPDHPILKGMPTRWYQQDELYNYMRGPGTNMTVLATAYSAKPRDEGGSGRHEPMLVTVTYGQGNIFHTALGHDVRSIRDKGFALTFTRGAEWVATGAVTLPAPHDIPRPTLPHEAVATMDDQASYMAMNTLLSELGSLADDPQRLSEVEAVLIGYLADPNMPFLGLQATCNALGIAGTREAVPALARLLAQDAERASAARLALERIPGPEATEALLVELERGRDFNRVGIINSLGQRRDSRAVPALARLAASESGPMAAAATDALGKMGTGDALGALKSLPDSAGRTAALTVCAHHLVEEGQAAQALPVFEYLLDRATLATHTRTAALRGLLMVDATRGMRHVWGMLDDQTASPVALNVLGGVPGSEQLALEILGHLDGLPVPTQLILLSILGDMRQPAALAPMLAVATDNSDTAIRKAAVEALGKLPGTDASMGVLSALAFGEDRTLQEAAYAALVSTPGTDAERLIIEGLSRGQADRRVAYMEIAAKRDLGAACPALLRAATDPEPDVQKGAYRALRTLAGPDQYPALIRLAAETSDEMRNPAVRAAVYAGRKGGDPADRLAPLATVLDTANDEVRVALMPVLTDIGDSAALVIMSTYAQSGSSVLHDGAIENIGKWNHPAAIDTVLDLARSSGDAGQKARWMSVFSRLIARMGDIPSETKLEYCRQALDIGLDIHGQRAVLGVLGGVMEAGTIELLEELGKEPELAEATRRAIPAVKRGLLGPPTLTASHNAAGLGSAVDLDPDTRWSTNRSMAPGMWLGIDLRMPSKIHGITLDCRGSDGDYPRGYRVYITDKRDVQGAPVAIGRGTGPVTRIELASPVEGRFIRVVQTGEHSLYWSVHELTVSHDPGLGSVQAPHTSLDDLLDGDGMITGWMVAGPYTVAGKDGRELFDVRFAPELDIRMAGWEPLDPEFATKGMVNLDARIGGDNRVAYLLATINADSSQFVTLGLGSDDGIQAWLNGEPVHQNMAIRPVAVDADKVPVRLQQGANTLLLKIVEVSGNWGACARISAATP